MLGDGLLNLLIFIGVIAVLETNLVRYEGLYITYQNVCTISDWYTCQLSIQCNNYCNMHIHG